MLQCAKCSSRNMIENGVVFDTAQNTRHLLEAGFQQDPTALYFTGDIHRPVRATICGDCGYIELFAKDSQALLAMYRQVRGVS